MRDVRAALRSSSSREQAHQVERFRRRVDGREHFAPRDDTRWCRSSRWFARAARRTESTR